MFQLNIVQTWLNPHSLNQVDDIKTFHFVAVFVCDVAKRRLFPGLCVLLDLVWFGLFFGAAIFDRLCLEKRYFDLKQLVKKQRLNRKIHK